jgi:hypothetical protein
MATRVPAFVRSKRGEKAHTFKTEADVPLRGSRGAQLRKKMAERRVLNTVPCSGRAVRIWDALRSPTGPAGQL